MCFDISFELIISLFSCLFYEVISDIMFLLVSVSWLCTLVSKSVCEDFDCVVVVHVSGCVCVSSVRSCHYQIPSVL